MDLLNNDKIVIIKEIYPDFFNSLILFNGYKLNKNQLAVRTLIDWEVVENTKSIIYYFDDCEKIIKESLLNSVINNENLTLFIEFGPNEPMIMTNGSYFVNNWDDFILDYGSMGTTIVSENGKYIMEFSDDTDWLLYTNFEYPDHSDLSTA